MELSLTAERIYFIGDTHGFFQFVKDKCSQVKNSVLIHVGDFGLGVESYYHDTYLLDLINEACYKNNNKLIIIRGNHDSPIRFDEVRHLYSHIIFPVDYDVISINEKTFQFIGGAISIDRMDRTLFYNYWLDEKIVQDLSKCRKVDIVVTHSAPNFCFPIGINSVVRGYGVRDEKLIEELLDEREYLTKVFEICQPKEHFYGHFHAEHTDYTEKCKHVCLDINQFYRYY